MNNRKIIHIWLRFQPECLKFIETLAKHEHIPITIRYLRCFALTQRKCRKRKSDPLTIPEEYSFLGEIVE